MVTGLSFDQLCGYPYAVPGLAHAAFKHIAHAEFAPDFFTSTAGLVGKAELRAITNSEG